MAVYSSPSIPLDGLIFSIDAGNAKSYNGTGANALDTVSNNVGILTNGVTYNANLSGYFLFDGLDDYINCGNNLSLNLSTFTASVWIYPKSLSSRRNILSKENNANWVLAVGQVPDKVSFWINNNTWVRQDSISNIISNTWTHILVTYDNTTKKIYINGQFDSEQIASNIILNSSTQLLVSNNPSNLSTYFFDGRISTIQIYNRALTASEVVQLYNATKDRYSYKEDIAKSGLVLNYDVASPVSYINPSTTIQSTINNYVGTLTNGPTYNSGNGGYLSFDGVDDYILIPVNSALKPSSALTVEVWASLTNNSVNQHFVALQYGSLTDNSYVMYYIPPFLRTIIGIGSQNMISYSANLSTNVWYQLTQTFDGTLHKLYINGNLVGSNPCVGNILYNSLNTNLLIGSDYYTNYNQGLNAFLNGKIASCRIYNRALSSTEILSNFNALRGRYGI